MRNFISIILFLMVFSVTSERVFSAEKDNELDLNKFRGLSQIIENSDMKDKLLDALKDAGTNWESLASAIISTTGEKQDDLLWQITVMPHLDRLEATEEILLEHLEYSYRAKEEFQYKVPEDMFREYILVYRIGDEPLTPWRKLIYERFVDMAGSTPAESAKNVNEWIYENVHERKRGFFGPRQAPDQVIKNGLGTKEDIATITTAALKCLGVPSRKARCKYFGDQKDGATWVEIYDGTDWIPLYPDDAQSFGDFNRFEKEYPNNITVVATTSAFSALQITEKYTETGTLELTFIRHGVPMKDFEHFGISVYNDGGWYPLDDLGFDLEESRMSTSVDAMVPVVLGDGTYLVQAGARIKDGSVYMFAKELELKAGDVIPMTIELDPPINQLKRKDLVVRELDELPEWELPMFDADGILFSNIAYMSNYNVIVIFDLNSEPPTRMLPTLTSVKKVGDAKIKVWGIHAGPVDENKLRDFIEEHGIDFPITIDNSGDAAESFGLKRKKDDDKHFGRLPSILVLYRRGDLLLWQEGYELGIADYILDVVANNEKKV